MSGATAYRRLLLLYPRALREAYGEEMVLVYSDLRRRHGRRVWLRLLLDLSVSVPRTRLESVMSTTPSTRTVMAIEAGAVLMVSALALFAFGPLALPLPVVLLTALVVAQQSRLGRSLAARPASSGIRTAATGLAVSGAVLGGTIASWLMHVRTYPPLGDTTVAVHTALGIGSTLGVLVFVALLGIRMAHRRPGGAH